MRVVHGVLVVVLSFFGSTYCTASQLSLDALLDKLQKYGYDRRSPPSQTRLSGSLTTIDVGVEATIESLSKLDESSSTLGINLLLHQHWTDTRLVIAPASEDVGVDDAKSVIWIPELMMVSSASTDQQSPPVNVRISSNGTAQFSQSRTLSLPCQIFSSDFPFDKTECKLVVRPPINIKKGLIRLSWNKEAANLTTLPQVPGFHIENVTFEGDSDSDELVMKVLLQRYCSRYMAHFFAPSIGLVLLSFLTFFFPRKSPELKLGVASTTLIIISILAVASWFEAPKSSGFTALDTWFFFCTLFVGFPMVQVAVLFILTRPRPGPVDPPAGRRLLADLEPSPGRKTRRPVTVYERVSCGVYAILFIVFVFIYSLSHW